MTEEIRTEQETKSGFGAFLEHQKAMVNELGQAIGTLFPPEFREHTRNAGKAFVDSFKALLEGVKPGAEGEEEAKVSEHKVKVEVK